MPVETKVEAQSANKVLYFWQPIEKYEKQGKVDKKIEMLGLQGATSTTNTKNITTTQTKTAAIKTVGQTNQQRVVEVIFDKKQKLFYELYQVWSNEERIGLWRVDMNFVEGKKPGRKVVAEYTECLIPNLPTAEALAGVLQSNITFEVQGESRTLDDKGEPFTLNESDFQNPDILDEAAKFFYEFSHGMKPNDKPENKVDDAQVDKSTVE